jgi:CheY-like chemotaxis protein
MELSGTKVMVVEDDALVSMLLEANLKELGCEVVAIADRLDDALEKAGKVTMDVVMLDINLAGKLSYPVAGVLCSRGIPFVFATGYGTIGLPAEFQGSPVLSKPYSQRQLENALLAATTA